MRSYLPDCELVAPKDLAEALEKMAREPGQWRPFAGGTDLMVLAEAGKLPHKRFLSIRHLAELRGIEVDAEHVTLGALTTYTDVQRNSTLHAEFPLLCRAASETGSVATQNRGTLGGNIANASPAADSPPALLVYGAELELLSAAGFRWVPYGEFHTGYKQMILHPDELIGRIRLPRTLQADEGAPHVVPFSQWKHYYRKVGTRSAQAISKVCFAGAAQMGNGSIADVRIALGSVAPTVIRCPKTETLLRNEKPTPTLVRRAQDEIAGEISPIDDFRSTARYRARVARNLLAEFAESLS